MGLLRFYLALCVIAGHAGGIFPWTVHNAVEAVQIFYLISGFYMAMVLSTRYDKVGDFYRSRFLRVFPLYWFICAGTVFWSLLVGLFFHNWVMLGPFFKYPPQSGMDGILYVSLSNLTLLGQDWVMFLSQPYGQPLHWTANFIEDGSHALAYYLLVPQCWSIGLELTFYLFAPFLNRMAVGWLILIAACSTGARFFGYYHLGLERDPWMYRFFPFELSLFLFGMLSYRLYARTKRYYPQAWVLSSKPKYFLGCVSLLAALHWGATLTSHHYRHIDHGVILTISYAAMAMVLPLLFLAFGKRKDDRFVGELSYPIYLIHYLVIMTVEPLLQRFVLYAWGGVVTAVITIPLAVVCYYKIIAPLDARRHLLTTKEHHKGAIVSQAGLGATA